MAHDDIQRFIVRVARLRTGLCEACCMHGCSLVNIGQCEAIGYIQYIWNSELTIGDANDDRDIDIGRSCAAHEAGC